MENISNLKIEFGNEETINYLKMKEKEEEEKREKKKAVNIEYIDRQITYFFKCPFCHDEFDIDESDDEFYKCRCGKWLRLLT